MQSPVNKSPQIRRRKALKRVKVSKGREKILRYNCVTDADRRRRDSVSVHDVDVDDLRRRRRRCEFKDRRTHKSSSAQQRAWHMYFFQTC